MRLSISLRRALSSAAVTGAGEVFGDARRVPAPRFLLDADGAAFLTGRFGRFTKYPDGLPLDDADVEPDVSVRAAGRDPQRTTWLTDAGR